MDSYHGRLVIGILILQDVVAVRLLAVAGDGTPSLWALKEVFLVGFFLQVGLAGLPDDRGWLLIGLLLLFLPLKGILFFALMLLFRLRARTAILGSISLTAYSEFASIVVAGLAEAGLIADTLIATVAAYDHLVGAGKRPLGIDADPAQIKKMLESGRRILYGDANDPELWTGLDLFRVNGVMLTLDNASAEISAAQSIVAKSGTYRRIGPKYTSATSPKMTFKEDQTARSSITPTTAAAIADKAVVKDLWPRRLSI